jgi:hypothetical protein
VSAVPPGSAAPSQSGAPAGGPDSLAFAQLLLNLLDEGRRTATYKLAVLLALLDCCALGTDAAGRAPDAVATRDLARRVLELYWPQVRDYAGPDGSALVLRQSSQPRAVTVEAVARLREQASVVGARTPASAAARLPDAYRDALDTIELNLVQMPLGKLQRPSGFSETSNADYPRFLYDDTPFSERVTARQMRARPLHVALRPGVADWLVGLTGLLRPLLELHWTREVARYNRVALPEDGLRDFLFGSERESLVRLRPGLLDVQDGRCFYCGAGLSHRGTEVDHFVPWSRVPNDGLGNLVLTDRRCNNTKRDSYADLPLVERWAARPHDVLRQVADDAGWPLRGEESRRIARGLYAHLPSGTSLWQSPGVFTVLDRSRLPEVLARLETP